MGRCTGVSKTFLSTGMAASRVGLWSFDLIQVKQLQDTLANHPRRNTLSVDGESLMTA
jgi:solute carrier family 40 (iron-regulated transporter), member 1